MRSDVLLRWCLGVALTFAVGCGRSVREREEGGPSAGEGGIGDGATGGSATGGTAGTSTTGGSPAGGAAGTSTTGGSPTGGTAGTTPNGGSSTGGVAGTTTTGGSPTGGPAGEGGTPDVPGFDDFIIRSERMSAYEGLRVIATYDHNFGPDSRSDARTAVITNGAFELRWVEGFNRDSFGTYATLFVDRGNDLACTTEVDPAWSDFRSNRSEPGTPEILDFDPAMQSGAVGPLSCDEFNNWFDEPYRPPQ